MFSWIAQTIAVTALNLKTIPLRLASSTVAIVGIAGVVVVLVSVLSIAQGFTAAMRDSGSASRALVMRDEVSIVEGRMLQFGTTEVVVGRGASRQFAGLTLGNEIVSGQNRWTVVGIFEGNADPKQFIPRMIELWQEGRFPFDRLIETFTLSQIDEAEQASLDGSVIKPVLLP